MLQEGLITGPVASPILKVCAGMNSETGKCEGVSGHDRHTPSPEPRPS
jgi:hypothetical protein